jgi:alkanesulfonate monooxygenase SsuD/methylene tetrahydromethanopterin reductase-like flavin-dependent oxidoreductase (luciferase family)
VDVGVGTPATIPGTVGQRVQEWAQVADASGFSSIGIIDRIAYPNHEPLATLAVCAGATQAIRLMTTVLVAPIRSAGLLAKQAATIDSLSDGRLVLGLGIGGREEDYLAASSGTPFSERARQFEDHLALMRRVWAGEPPRDDVASVGPAPVQEGGPPILLGGYSEPAARRAGRLGDGFIAGPLDPAEARRLYETASGAASDAGRRGRFRFVGCVYWALGDDNVLEHGRENLRDYYAFAGRGDAVAAGMLDSADAIKERLSRSEDAGMDEVVLWPCLDDLDQLDRLGEVLGL